MAVYLVTGGCGFIGSHLCDYLLAQGNKVRVIDNLFSGKIENLSPNVEFIEGDILDTELLVRCMKGIQGCFHLAAITSTELTNIKWKESHEINMTGTINVFLAAKNQSREKPIPVIYASSAAVYGDNNSIPLKENLKTTPISAYGADKQGCELHARIASHVHGIPTVGLRFFNVYGPRQDPHSPYSGVISKFIEQIKHDKPVTIFGDGNQSRDFIYVDDVIKYLDQSMQLCRQENEILSDIYNVCTMKSTTINNLANIISKNLQKTLKTIYAEKRCGDIYASLGDNSVAKMKFNYVAKTTLEQGIKKTVTT